MNINTVSIAVFLYPITPQNIDQIRTKSPRRLSQPFECRLTPNPNTSCSRTGKFKIENTERRDTPKHRKWPSIFPESLSAVVYLHNIPLFLKTLCRRYFCRRKKCSVLHIVHNMRATTQKRARVIIMQRDVICEFYDYELVSVSSVALKWASK